MVGMFSLFEDDIDIIVFFEVLNNEIYKNSECMCECCCLIYNGNFYYIFYRRCFCGIYNDRIVLNEGFELFVGYI